MKLLLYVSFKVKVNRSLPIHLEVGMKHLDCVEPVTLKYIWKVRFVDKKIRKANREKNNNKTMFAKLFAAHELNRKLRKNVSEPHEDENRTRTLLIWSPVRCSN